MGYKAPNAEFPPDDDPEEPQRSNGHHSSSPRDEGETSEDSTESSDAKPPKRGKDQGKDDKTPPLPGLGLPDDYDRKNIPTFSELRRAADRRLDWETAFMILHHDDPDLITARLDEMAEMIRAAISVQGPQLGNPERLPSLKRAVRLGLSLSLGYWQRANKVDAWLDLISPLLTTAIQMEEFQSAVFRIWSIYHYAIGDQAKAQKAMEASREFAVESGREDLVLLAKAYQFNFDAPKMALVDAEKQAQELIDQARRLGYEYVEGRVYHALARAYAEHLHDSKKIFEYGQQALIIFVCNDHYELANETLVLMLGVTGIKNDHSVVYRDALRTYFQNMAQKGVSPAYQAALYFFQGRDQHYFRGEYDEAMLPLLYAWRKYRQAYLPVNVARTLHMLGMVQTKRRKWSAAEFYLREAARRYHAMGSTNHEVNALHAYAFVPYEYGDWVLTLSRLEAVHALALQHINEVAQDLVKEIEGDIAHVKAKLQDCDPV